MHNESCGCFNEFGDAMINVGENEYAVCHTHRWYHRVGSNLTSCWKNDFEFYGGDRAERLWEERCETLERDFSPIPDWMRDQVDDYIAEQRTDDEEQPF